MTPAQQEAAVRIVFTALAQALADGQEIPVISLPVGTPDVEVLRSETMSPDPRLVELVSSDTSPVRHFTSRRIADSHRLPRARFFMCAAGHAVTGISSLTPGPALCAHRDEEGRPCAAQLAER